MLDSAYDRLPPWDRLQNIMARLRSPEGCPWDRAQTHLSIRGNLEEECAELLEAVGAGDDAMLREELGDVLLQVVFHARIAEEEGRFTADDVINGLCDKLIGRHPHVFGDVRAQNQEEALAFWNEAKALEKDILTRVLRMGEWLSLIEEQAPRIKEERFESLRERLNEVLEQYGQGLDEGRFLQEITLLADKLDVSEEAARLAVHLERLRELLAAGEDAGRRLDFTMQECFREINTCGNKLQSAQLARIVVDFKNELEKCREQVQNLE